MMCINSPCGAPAAIHVVVQQDEVSAEGYKGDSFCSVACLNSMIHASEGGKWAIKIQDKANKIYPD